MLLIGPSQGFSSIARLTTGISERYIRMFISWLSGKPPFGYTRLSLPFYDYFDAATVEERVGFESMVQRY